MGDPGLKHVVLGVFVLVWVSLILAAGLTELTGCSDGFVYMSDDTYQGCVPYEDIKEKK